MDILYLKIKTLYWETFREKSLFVCYSLVQTCQQIEIVTFTGRSLLPGWSGAVGTTVSVGLDGDGTVVKDEVSVWLEMVAAGIVGRKLVTSSTWDSKITALSQELRE